MAHYTVDGQFQFDIPIEDNKTPQLEDWQKSEIQDLMSEYFANKSKFVYDGSFRRSSYTYPNAVTTLNGGIEGCMYKGKYVMNCGLFAQMIWMGRQISDFTAIPTTAINTAFDWGYYFQFKSKAAYGIKKNANTYYSDNTYINDYGNKVFITFDNAAAVAQELYKLGCEIPYSQADIGDLVFYRSKDVSDGETDSLEQSSFRYITHVGIVYDKAEDGTLTIMESSSAYKACIGKSGLGDDVTAFGNVRGAGYEQRVVMCARHPIAFGIESNVPEEFNQRTNG